MALSMSASPSAILVRSHRAVLVIEQHKRAVRIEARRRARVLQHKQREQSHDLRFGGEEA
jgi:hypothetical protein